MIHIHWAESRKCIDVERQRPLNPSQNCSFCCKILLIPRRKDRTPLQACYVRHALAYFGHDRIAYLATLSSQQHQ